MPKNLQSKFILPMANMLLIAAFILSCSSNDSSIQPGDGVPSSSSMENGGGSSSSTPSSLEPLACDTVPASGYATFPITPPDLTCGNGEKATNIRWLGSPAINWNNPKESIYSDISVMANCGTMPNLMASCPGILMVQPMVSCSVANTGYEGIAITPPVLACSDGSVPLDILFSGYLPNWDNPAVGSYAVFAEANCGHGTLPVALCGVLKVNEITLSCDSVPTSGYEGVEIKPPHLTCNHGTRGIPVWTNAPDWSYPAIGTYSSINVTVTCGSVTREANCGGSLSVSCSGYSNTTTHYCSDGTMKEYGFVTYGEQTYKTVVIGTQTWMAENLNYEAEGSKCYDNDPSNCATYGRLYDWETAMAVCPSGWHLPSRAEWNTLSSYVQNNSNCSKCDIVKLKAASGWVSYNSTDEYGFSALPGGYGRFNGIFESSNSGYWWSASDGANSNSAYSLYMIYNENSSFWYEINKLAVFFSVRCLQDPPRRIQAYSGSHL